MFEQKFGKYVTEADSIKCEVDGFTCTATVYYDDNADPPDKRCDGFWPSLDPESAGYIGPKSKRSLQRKAKEVMRAWLADEWFYFGVAVTVKREGVELTGRYDHALWGIEGNYPGSDNDYLREVANELLPEALRAAEASRLDTIEKLTGRPLARLIGKPERRVGDAARSCLPHAMGASSMNNSEAIKELNQLIRQRKELQAAVKRKRSWRASEAAMACAHYARQIEALERAVQALSPRTVSFTAPTRTVGPARGERSK